MKLHNAAKAGELNSKLESAIAVIDMLNDRRSKISIEVWAPGGGFIADGTLSAEDVFILLPDLQGELIKAIEARRADTLAQIAALD